MLGLWSQHNAWNEAIQNTLSSSIQPNLSVNYVLSFRARVTNTFFGSQNLPATLIFAGSQNQVPPISGWYNSTPAILSTLVSQIVPNNNQWNYFSISFTNSNTFPINYLTIINAAYSTSNPVNHSTNVLIDEISILVDGTQSLLTPPTTLCINQLLPDLSLYVNPPGGFFSGNGVTLNAGTYSFDPALAGVGNHSITYTYTSSLGCVYDITTIIEVVNSTINVSITPLSPTICSGQSTTLTAIGATSYVWNPGNFSGNPYVVSPTTTTTYTVTGTDANGCSSTSNVTVTVDPNCGNCTNCSTTLSGTITTSPPANQTYCINSDIYIAGNIVFNLSEFKMAANVTITVDNTAVLTIRGSHLYSCNNMWQGIVVKPGGRINVQPFLTRSTLIEDAFIAIDIQSNPTIVNNPLIVKDATFNRNQISIQVTDYSRTTGAVTYPMSIENTVFTSRDIPFTPNSLVWTHTNVVKGASGGSVLQSPYINDATFSPTNANAYLKPPFAASTTKPLAGIKLVRVGATQTPLTPIYHEMKIGTTGMPKFNVFDNLRICIDAISSNFTCVNNVFQNNPANPNQAVAINAVAANLTVNRFRVIPAVANNFTNRFYDVGRAINAIDYYEMIATRCELRSSHITTAPIASPGVFNGKHGFITQTNRFKTVNFSNNTMYNV